LKSHEVLHAIQQLPEAYREILIMRLVEQMTGPEIAAKTGRSHGAVRVHLFKGMALLRDRLSSEVNT
jgi:RNA polymerase sigma-70 factor (ECF subfamily)